MYKKKNILEGEGEEEMQLISQRCYPTEKVLDEMPEFIEKIPDEKLKQVLKIILCSGLRIGEALNSFVYLNDENKRVIQFPIEKKYRITKHKMNKRGFLGASYLEAYLKIRKPNIWSSKKMYNPFELDMGWIGDETSEDSFHPTWLFEKCNYRGLFKELKYTSLPKLKVIYYKDLDNLMDPITVEFLPSFHFYRKCACAQFIRTGMFNVVTLAQYIHWADLKQSMTYVKDFGAIKDSNELKEFELYQNMFKKKRFD
jgi:hypothetical protein